MKNHTNFLEVKLLHCKFKYDPDSGLIINRNNRSSNSRIGELAGSESKTGYRIINVKGVRYKAHRIAWAMFYGHWPKNEIDHRNGDKSDNRIENLREANRCENAQNFPKTKRNKSGLKGVSWSKACRKWKAVIQANGKSFYIGRFDDKREAEKAYNEQAKSLHGQFMRVHN